MQTERPDSSYLWDILDAASAIRQFVWGKTLADFQGDRMLRGAVERHLEIIGEAAGRVSKQFQEATRRFHGAELSVSVMC